MANMTFSSVELSRASSRAARLAPQAVFSSGASDRQIEDKAVAFISGILDGGQSTSLSAHDEALQLAGTPSHKCTSRAVLDGRQRDLRHLPLDVLLGPLRISPSYRPSVSIERWLSRLTFGGRRIEHPDQFGKDLGLDLKRHAANLNRLRDTCPAGWRLLCGAKLGQLQALTGGMPALLDLVDTIVHDQAIVLGVLRARMLAEYLRRFATEPMGPRLTEDDPLWVRRGAACLDRLVKPTSSLDKLLQLQVPPGSISTTLRHAIGSGHLAYDPRFLPLARRIYKRCGGAKLDADASQQIINAVRSIIRPVTAITPAMLRDDGLGWESFAEAQLGLSVPEAVTVLAMNLVALPTRMESDMAELRKKEPAHALATLTPTLPATDGRVRRVTNALKAISDCDRQVGDTSTNPDNKAGRKLLRRTQEILSRTDLPPGVRLLQISPAEWLQ